MLRRFVPFSPSWSSLACIAAVGTAVACGNISLTNASGFDAPAGTGLAHGPDASSSSSSDGGATEVPFDSGAIGTIPDVSDAGASAPVSSGNPLCFYGYTDGGAHNCVPDTSSQCAGDVDSGAYVPSSDGGGPACHVVASGQTCTGAAAGGSGGDGAQCQSGADCAATFECVGSPGVCRHYCCGGNATCDSASDQMAGATFCDVQATTSGGLNVPVCEPVTKCTPLVTGPGAGSCPSGETCAVVKDDGTTSCVAIGTVGIGGDCDVWHCAAELTCLGASGNRTCFQLCQVDSPTACPAGKTCTSSAQLFSNANIGICQ